MDEYGRPEVPLASTEIETLLGLLDCQRATLAWKCRGLSDEQLRVGLRPTSMTLGGMLKHLSRVEDYWFGEVVAERQKPEPWASMPWADEWQNAAADTGEALRQLWVERVDRPGGSWRHSSKPRTPRSARRIRPGTVRGVPACGGCSCT